MPVSLIKNDLLHFRFLKTFKDAEHLIVIGISFQILIIFSLK